MSFGWQARVGPGVHVDLMRGGPDLPPREEAPLAGKTRPVLAGARHRLGQDATSQQGITRRRCSLLPDYSGHLLLLQEASYWVVGPSLGGRQGAVVGQPVWPEPHNVTSWRVFNDAYGGYVDDATTSVTCSCPGLRSLH